MTAHRTIVIGGGLAGLSAAHTLLENGKKVLLLDKKPSLGGNSVKASSGINGAGTEAQEKLNITDTPEAFSADTTSSAGPLARPALITALTSGSSPALCWLTTQHGIDLSIVSRLGGHSIARTHRDKSGAPGWAITSVLMKKLVSAAAEENRIVEIVKNARVTRLLEDGGRVVGVEYETAEGKVEERGDVIIATGGYAADFSSGGLLATHRPDLLTLSTTNGDHATGDGHRLASSLKHPAALCDLDQVQVHPTGFVDPANIDAKTKFLAAEALRGVGGLIIDREGRRFVNEVDRRDVVTEKMEKIIRDGRGPVRLVLNAEAVKEIKSHCDFYVSKGLMKAYVDAKEFSEASGISLDNLTETFAQHTKFATGDASDPFGKATPHNAIYTPSSPLHVALITPVVHYTMGGISVDAAARVLDAKGRPIPGLYAAGEVIGGVHGRNRLAGSSLLEAVVFGRLAGRRAGGLEL